MVLLGTAGLAAQDARTALVVGNANYQYFGSLANPQNDARDVGLALESLGFDVTTLLDATERELMNAIRDFGSALTRNKGIGLFYYAGHGIESEGKNYLIPVDADIRAQDEVRFSSIEMGFVLSKMENARNPTNIVILDACRDNPLPAEGRTTGSSRGLSIVEAPTGSLIVYATQPGNVAADGADRNSPFTEAFLEHVATPDVDVELMFRMVRQSVMETTANQQVPWTNSSLTRSVVLRESRGPDTGLSVVSDPQPADDRDVPQIIMTEYGSVSVDTITPGDLYFDGRFMTSMTAGAEVMLPRLEAGTYSVEMQYDDETEVQEITVTGGQMTRVRFDYRPRGASGGRTTVTVPDRLTVGTRIDGSLDGTEEELEYYGYVDWYPLSVQNGQAVSITLESYDYDTYLLVEFPDGRELTNDDSDGTNSALTFVPDFTGDVRVGATSFYTEEIGSYTLSAGSSTVANIRVGQSTTEVLGAGDDLYTVSGYRGQTIQITLSSDAFDTTLDLEGPDGQTFYNDDYGDSLDSQIVYSFPSAGTATITVGGYDTGRYTLSVEEISADQFEPGHRLRDGDELTGQLTEQSPELDGSYYQLFSFQASGGDRVTIDMISSTVDSYLRVVAPDGSEFEDDDGGEYRDARLDLTASASGTYDVYATTYFGDQTGVYTISLTRRGSIPSAETVHGTLTVGGQVRGDLSGQEDELDYYGYVDWFPLEVERGGPVTVRLSSDDFDTYLLIRMPDGTEYTNDDSDGTNSAVTFVSAAGGTVQIAATSYSSDETGDYVLSAETATIETIRVGESVVGSTADGDVVYTLTGRTGQVVQLSVSSDEFDTTLDLEGPVGDTLYSDDYGPGTDSQLLYRFPGNGEALLTVGGWGSGSYRLTVERLEVGTFEAGHRLSDGDRLVGVLDESSPTMDGSPFQMFTLDAQRGDRITVTMESPTLDSFLRVVGPDGEVRENDDGFGGRNAQLSISVDTPGIYEVFARGYWGDEYGVYSVSMEILDASDVIYDAEGSLSADDPMEDGSHYDVHEFRLARGGTVIIDVIAPDFDGYATLKDDSGQELAYDDDSGGDRNPRIEYEAGPGTYQLVVTSYFDEATGDYQVTVAQP